MNISEKAMLVNLNIRQWTARKYDRKITDEVNHTHQATDAGRFNKLLIQKERLTPIQKAANNLRLFHYDNTLAWADEGDRLLPVANFFEYSSKINLLKEEFERAVSDFIGDYQLIIQEAKQKLNGLYNPLDYPNDIADRFGVKFNFMPVPDSKDFRVSLGAEQMESMREQLNVEVTNRLDNATNSLKNKIKEQLLYTRDRLSDAKPIFRDSLFNNITALSELAPKLNVTNDAYINDLVLGMRDLDYDPQSVRDNAELRITIVRKINNLLTACE